MKIGISRFEGSDGKISCHVKTESLTSGAASDIKIESNATEF